MNQSVLAPAPAEKPEVSRTFPGGRSFLAVAVPFDVHGFAPRSVFDVPQGFRLDGNDDGFVPENDGFSDEDFLDCANAVNIVAEKNAPTLEWLRAWNGNDSTWPLAERSEARWWLVVEIGLPERAASMLVSSSATGSYRESLNRPLRVFEPSKFARRAFSPPAAEYSRCYRIVAVTPRADWVPTCWNETAPADSSILLDYPINEPERIIHEALPLDEALTILREQNRDYQPGDAWVNAVRVTDGSPLVCQLPQSGFAAASADESDGFPVKFPELGDRKYLAIALGVDFQPTHALDIDPAIFDDGCYEGEYPADDTGEFIGSLLTREAAFRRAAEHNARILAELPEWDGSDEARPIWIVVCEFGAAVCSYPCSYEVSQAGTLSFSVCHKLTIVKPTKAELRKFNAVPVTVEGGVA